MRQSLGESVLHFTFYILNFVVCILIIPINCFPTGVAASIY
jgi:hypothetical protein